MNKINSIDDVLKQMNDVPIEEVASEPTERKTPKGFSNVNLNEFANSIPETKPITENEPQQETKWFSETNEDIENDSAPANKSSDKEAEESGQTGAYLISSAIETVFGVAERIVFTRKFNADEKARLLENDNKKFDDLSSDDQNLNLKFLALQKKHDKIRERIPMKDTEVENLAKGLTEYAKVTGKKFDPQLLLWVTIIKSVTDKSMDIFL